MQDHRRDADAAGLPGDRAGRRADSYAGAAVFGLSLFVGILALLSGGLRIPGWLWAGILVLWWAAISYCTSSRLSRAEQLALYGCAILASWVLLVAAPVPSGGTIVILLIVVTAIGCYVLRLRSVLVVVVLNSLVTFGYLWTSTNKLMESAGFTGIHLIIHLFAVFVANASLQEARMRAELEQKNLDLEAAGVLLKESAATAERLRISRDLHDLAGHHLTVLNLELEAAKHRDDGGLGEHVGRAGTLAKDLLADVRGTVGQLREVSPMDLRQSLGRLAAAVPSLEVHVEVEPGVQADDETSTALIRAAQEFIASTIAHAEAAELALSVTMQEGMLTLTCTHDGAAPHSHPPDHGFSGLREHLEPLGGTLDIRTTPYFTVVAQLPV